MRYSFHYVVLFALFCGVRGGRSDFWKKIWLSKHPRNHTEDVAKPDRGISEAGFSEVRHEGQVAVNTEIYEERTALSVVKNEAKHDAITENSDNFNTDASIKIQVINPPLGTPPPTAVPTVEELSTHNHDRMKNSTEKPTELLVETNKTPPSTQTVLAIKLPTDPPEKTQDSQTAAPLLIIPTESPLSKGRVIIGTEKSTEQVVEKSSHKNTTDISQPKNQTEAVDKSIVSEVSDVFDGIAKGFGINGSKPLFMKVGHEIDHFMNGQHSKFQEITDKLNVTSTLHDIVKATGLVGSEADENSRKRGAPISQESSLNTETTSNVTTVFRQNKTNGYSSPDKGNVTEIPSVKLEDVDALLVSNLTSNLTNEEGLKKLPTLASLGTMLHKESDKLKLLVRNLTSPEALSKISHVFDSLLKKQEESHANSEQSEQSSDEEYDDQADEPTPGKSITKIKEMEEYDTSESDEVEESKIPELESIAKEVKALETKDFRNKLVCDEYLGCFNTGAPWRTPDRPCVLPDDPQKLNTRIHHFNGSHSRQLYEYFQLDIDDMSFTQSHETYFIVHGLYSSGNAEWVQKMAGVLKKKHANVMVVDWSGAHEIEGPVMLAACGNIRVVAREMAALVRVLHKKKGMKMTRTHCIGHGHGAHICGLMGKNLTSTDLKLGSITALEATHFPFEDQPSQVRLAKTDARTVVAHHSQALPTGPGYTGTNIGSINFYYNGGIRQPGCPLPDSLGKLPEKIAKTVFVSLMFNKPVTYDIPEVTVSPWKYALCSHNRVHDYFIEAISGECEYYGRPFDPRNAIDGVLNGLTNGVFVRTLGSRMNCSLSDDCLAVGLDFTDYPEFGVYEILTKRKAPFCLRDGDVMTREERLEEEMSLYGKFLATYEKLLRFVLKL